MMDVTAKLGNMRKAQEFVVYPPREDGKIMVQSNKSIGLFDPDTGKGILNIKGSYTPYLHPATGAKPYDFPQEFIDECKKKQPQKGDTIGGILTIG